MLLPTFALTMALASTGGDYSRSYGVHVRALRAHLLDDDYDKSVVPTSVRTERVPSSAAGTTVETMVRFFKVDGVDSATGSMQCKVWLRMR